MTSCLPAMMHRFLFSFWATCRPARVCLVIMMIMASKWSIIPSAEAVVAKAFSERVVVDLELGDLLVLVGCDGNERRLVERVRVERVPSHTEDVVRLHDMDSWLVLVHRVHYDLQPALQLAVYSATRYFGTKTLRTRMRHFSTVSRHFCTKNVVRDTSASDLRKVGHFGPRTIPTRHNSTGDSA